MESASKSNWYLLRVLLCVGRPAASGRLYLRVAMEGKQHTQGVTHDDALRQVNLRVNLCDYYKAAFRVLISRQHKEGFLICRHED